MMNFYVSIINDNESTNPENFILEETKDSHDSLSAEHWDDEKFENLLKENTSDSEQNPHLSQFVDKVIFKLWTLSPDLTLTVNQIKLYDDEQTINRLWLKNMPLKVIIHGWQSSAENTPGVFDITKVYTKQSGKFNMISVDWSFFAKKLNYSAVAKLCYKIGALVGQLLINLDKLKLVKPTMMHVIGHGIGSHIAGSAGDTYNKRKNKKIARISALDPPCAGFQYSWMYQAINKKLKKEHAVFVDVMKTTPHTISIDAQVGHAEFHPNDPNHFQPGCLVMDTIITWICSHLRAIYYYKESVDQSDHFESLKCSSMASFLKGECKDSERSHMGHYADSRFQGNFYLLTRQQSPYSTSLPLWENIEKSKPPKKAGRWSSCLTRQ